jgi:hypothetical protein
MSHASVSTNPRRSISVQTAGLVLSAALSCLCLNAGAQEPARARQVVAFAPERTLPDLEKAFWACDYTATVHGIVDAGTAIPCGIATEDLRQRKFNGDFNAMLGWWQQNKAAEYRALDRTYRAARHH